MLLLMALFNRGVSILLVGVPLALFIILAIFHERVIRLMGRRRRAVKHFERAIARVDEKWRGKGTTGDRYLDPAHPYAQDLDIFGKGSLFELLCTARTRIGEDTLAQWLLAPADLETVRARNAAVDELRPRLDLREDLAVLAEEPRTGVDPIALADWAEGPPLFHGTKLRIFTFVLTAIGLPAGCAFLSHLGYQMGLVKFSDSTVTLLRDFFLIVMLINGVFMYRLHRRVEAAVAAVNEAANELKLLSGILLRLEREAFQSPLLANLRSSLEAEGDPASKQMARLNRLMELLDSREHLAVRIMEPFTFWTAHLSFAVEDWRRHSGTVVRSWLQAVGEIEALSSLAAHAFEHAADPFPEFTTESPCLDAKAIAHPLIPEASVVRNDVKIGGDLRVMVISGSNMSGKSTLLRALGINVVLAQAGAPVRAASLRISPLAVGASIRISDSLQDGVSRFYAEILRLRQILDQTTGATPVLFLIDEFLHGTNSHDRRIGAEALVRGLVERGAIGFITTHDLALAEIAAILGERAANVHFEDQIEDGQIRFDYKMRPGVVRKSNAIELMRSVGLEI
jgi:hypothetical protein